jgi:hypothetical protein
MTIRRYRYAVSLLLSVCLRRFWPCVVAYPRLHQPIVWLGSDLSTNGNSGPYNQFIGLPVTLTETRRNKAAINSKFQLGREQRELED